jgi:hypothetical protein
MTASDPEAVCRTWGRPWSIGVFAVGLGLVMGGFLVTQFGSLVSPWVIFGCCVAVTVFADAFCLGVVARRSTGRAAALCGAVGVAAVIVQAGGVYLSALLVLDRLRFPGSGWLFWTVPAVALGLSVALLGRGTSRKYGWTVLIGSMEGFAGLIGFVAAFVAACDCLD